MRKIIPAIVILISIMGVIYFRNDKMIQEAKKNMAQFSSTELSSFELQDDNYGDVAYQYVSYIGQEYPGRIAGSEKEHAMAVFLLSALLNGGYTEKEIKVQNFKININSTPLQSISQENAISGGTIKDKSQNIEVTKKGTSEKTIVVGAHYDSVGTHGVDDNASGVATVLESALRFVDVETPYTIRYVFFGSEETGMFGSRAYVESLSKAEKENIVFMINIDSILAGDISYLYGGYVSEDGTVKDTWPVEQAYGICQELGLEIELPPEGNTAYPFPTGQKRSDHTPFSDIGIPYIYFEANNWLEGYPAETKEYGLIMHTEKDDLDFINTAYPERAKNTLKSYSILLNKLLQGDIN